MGKISDSLLNKLTEFVISEIGSKSLDGITYAFAFKNNADKAFYDRCKIIKKEVLDCGFGNDEIFRIYEVSNGYIFDLDVRVVRKITIELSKAVAKLNGGNIPTFDIIGDNPEKRKKEDMIRLARYLKQEIDNGVDKVEVALFSRNSVPRIVITGTGKNGEVLPVKYNAYAIRHWDLEELNANYLIPDGFRVFRIEPCEILPSKTGVRFILHLERL